MAAETMLREFSFHGQLDGLGSLNHCAMLFPEIFNLAVIRAFRHRDSEELQKEKHEEFKVFFKENDIMNWTFEMRGPPGTIYENGVFKGDIKFPTSYPFSPPIVTFASRMFHPNIGQTGRVCMNILHLPSNSQDSDTCWLPTLTVEKVLLSLSCLLAEPNPSSSLNQTAARLLLSDRDEYDRRVRITVEESLNKHPS